MLDSIVHTAIEIILGIFIISVLANAFLGIDLISKIRCVFNRTFNNQYKKEDNDDEYYDEEDYED